MSPGENTPQLDLDSIGTTGPGPETPDPKTQAEADTLEEYARNKRALEIQGIRLTLGQRKTYARAAFLLVCTWLTCVLLIAILQGLGAGTCESCPGWRFPILFHLDSSVMIALLATTTANIVAVLVIVMKYLFPNSDSRE